MSPVLKPWGTSQDGFRPWGVRTKPRLFGHGLSHRSVPSTSKPGHAAHGLQVGASLGSPGKPPLRRVHRLRGADGGGSSGRTRVWGGAVRPAPWCQRVPRPSLTRSTGGRCPERASGPPGQGCSGRMAARFGSLTGGWARVRGRARRAAPVLEVRGSGVDSVPSQLPARADCGRTCWDALAWASSPRRAGELRGKPRSGLLGPPRPASRARGCPAARNRDAHSSAARRKARPPGTGRTAARASLPFFSSSARLVWKCAASSTRSAARPAPESRIAPGSALGWDAAAAVRWSRRRGTRRRRTDRARVGPRACAPSRGGGCALRQPPGLLARSRLKY